jgi:hypothetical protein
MDELFWKTTHQLKAQSRKLKGIRRLRRLQQITSEALTKSVGWISAEFYRLL